MENEFNKADYDFLDDASMVVWVKEFLLRNPVFMQDWKNIVLKSDPNDFNVRINHRYKVQSEFFEKYGVRIHGFYSGKRPEEEDLIIGLPKVASAIRVADTSKLKDMFNKWQEYEEEKGPTGIDNYFYSIEQFFSTAERRLEILEILFASDYDRMDDLLFLSVDLRNNKGDLRKAFSDLLNIHCEKEKGKGKKAEKKWKYYLMAYDLRDRKYTYMKIVNILSGAYPNYKPKWDLKNVENYTKVCRNLIFGDYKKYTQPG